MSTNIWPEWHNQPLFLTREGINNPKLVLDQFFDCYHLPDIRTCLNNWLQDAMDKPTIESKQHVSTHNEVQKLVEAAWLIHQNNNEKYMKQTTREIKIYEQGDDILMEDKFNKPKRLIEKVTDDPLFVIREVFKAESLDFIKEAMGDWLHVGLVSESIRYQYGGQRAYLLDFCNQLLLLVEALYIINVQLQPEKNKAIGKDVSLLLTGEQRADPGSMIADFFKQFPVAYIRRELWDWFHAGITFGGTWPENLSPAVVINLYDYLSCLTEAAQNLSRFPEVGRTEGVLASSLS